MNCPACQRPSDGSSRTCAGCGAPLPVVAGSLIAGRYLVIERLGEGGMGTVFKARDRALEATVALKVVRLGREPRAVKRFHSEVRLARKVKHRNVCALYEYGEDGEVVYCTMELVEGRNLRQILREGLLDWPQGYNLALQAAEGLQAIHEAGVLHRDLKAPNLMIDAQGVARLVDFGIAKELAIVPGGDTPTPGSGDSEYFVGTPEYMSPEQVRGSPLDARSDIYSLGIVIYEVFTGRVPFRGETPQATMAKHLEEPPPLEDHAVDTIPPALVPVLGKALAKERNRRHASVRDLIKELKRASQETQTGRIPRSQAPPHWLLWGPLTLAGLVVLTWLSTGTLSLRRGPSMDATARDPATTTTLTTTPALTTIPMAPASPTAVTPSPLGTPPRRPPVTTSTTTVPPTMAAPSTSTTTIPPTVTLPPTTTTSTTTTTLPPLKPGDPCPRVGDLVLPECPACGPTESQPAAERLGLEGEVDVVIEIDEKGRLAAARVNAVRAVRNESQLRDLALKSARRRQYLPATWHGVPCRSLVEVTLKYVKER